MCAAPGGKTSHLFTLMKNTGNLTALDKSSSRLTSLRSISLNRAFTGLGC